MHLCTYFDMCVCKNAANKNIAVTFITDWERIIIGGIFLRKVFEFVISF